MDRKVPCITFIPEKYRFPTGKWKKYVRYNKRLLFNNPEFHPFPSHRVRWPLSALIYQGSLPNWNFTSYLYFCSKTFHFRTKKSQQSEVNIQKKENKIEAIIDPSPSNCLMHKINCGSASCKRQSPLRPVWCLYLVLNRKEGRKVLRIGSI